MNSISAILGFTSRPVQGELVAAQFSGDRGWYRAEVTNIDGEGCTLYFVDYGNSEVQKVENIRRVTNKIFTETPKQALVCGLFTEQPLSGFNSKIVNQVCLCVLNNFSIQ